MKTTTATPQTITAAAVVRALVQCLTLAAIAARAWLSTSHEFYAQDGAPIRCTGWQFVGYNLAAAAVALLLSIKY